MRILLLTGVALLPLIIAQNLPAQQADPVEQECCNPKVCKHKGGFVNDGVCRCCDDYPAECCDRDPYRDWAECQVTTYSEGEESTISGIGDTITSSINWDTVSTTTSVGDELSTSSIDTGTPFGDTTTSSINGDTVSTTTSVGDELSTSSTDTGTPIGDTTTSSSIMGQPESSSSIIGQPESSSINWDTVSTTTSVGDDWSTTSTDTGTPLGQPESSSSTNWDTVSTTTSVGDDWSTTSTPATHTESTVSRCGKDEVWCGSTCMPCSDVNENLCQQCSGWEWKGYQYGCEKTETMSSVTESTATSYTDTRSDTVSTTSYTDTYGNTPESTSSSDLSEQQLCEREDNAYWSNGVCYCPTNYWWKGDECVHLNALCGELGGKWTQTDFRCSCGDDTKIDVRGGIKCSVPVITPTTTTYGTTEVMETTIPATTPTTTSISYTTTTTPRWGETTTSGSVTTISDTSSRTGTTVTGFESTDPVVSSSW